MANNLGSMSSFEVDPAQDHTEVCGMRGATGYEGGNRPPQVRNKLGLPTLEQTAPVPKPAPAPSPASIPDLLSDTEKALANFEKHYQKRDCTALEAQLRNDLLGQLIGFHVQAEIKRGMAVLEGHYDKRWRHRSYLRIDAMKFALVAEARKCLPKLLQAKGAEFLPTAKELLEICRISLAEPRLLRPEEG